MVLVDVTACSDIGEWGLHRQWPEIVSLPCSYDIIMYLAVCCNVDGLL